MDSLKTSLRAGAAEIDITPPSELVSAGEIDLTGYVARLGPAIGIHDPLRARALVLDDGQRRAALLVCDLLALDAAYVAELRSQIALATGVPADATMVACTHTHSGPATVRLHRCGEVNPFYLDYLRPRLVEVTRMAASTPHTVTLTYGTGALPGAAYDRRHAGTSIDTRFGVAALRTSDGNLLALMLNYGCHPVVLTAANRHISADYPGALAARLSRATNALVLFLTGADGDVDPVDRGSFEAVEAMGKLLAQEALRVVGSLRQATTHRIAVLRSVIQAPLRAAPAPDTLRTLAGDHRRAEADADRSGQRVEARVQQAMADWAEETLVQALVSNLPTALPVEVQVVTIGPVSIVGISGELFSTLGATIKDSGNGELVLLAGYANGDVGYIPDQAAYDRGGYEVDAAHKYYGYPAALAPGCGEAVVRTAISLLDDLDAAQDPLTPA